MSSEDPLNSDAREMIYFSGVNEPLPKYWREKEAIYYCSYCQQPPPVEPNQVAVIIAHDHCSEKKLAGGLVQLDVLNNRLVNARLRFDPNADIS